MTAIDDATSRELRGLFAAARRSQLSNLVMLKDAGELAVTSFQGARLAQLEKEVREKERFAASSFFLDVVISVALSTVAGKILKAATNRIFLPLVRSRELVRIELKDVNKFSRDFLSMQQKSGATNEAVSAAYSKMDRRLHHLFSVSPSTDDYVAYRVARDAIIAGATRTSGEAISTSLAADERRPAPQTSKLPEVAVLSSVQDYVASESNAINILFDTLEGRLNEKDISQSRAEMLASLHRRKMMRTELRAVERSELKQKFCSLFESCMWVLYTGGPRIKEHGLEPEGNIMVPSASGGAPYRQTKYRRATESERALSAFASFGEQYKMYSAHWIAELKHPDSRDVESFADRRTYPHKVGLPVVRARHLEHASAAALRDVMTYFASIARQLAQLRTLTGADMGFVVTGASK